MDATYTRRFNNRHGRSEHLLLGRFKSLIVENDAYLIELSCYIVSAYLTALHRMCKIHLFWINIPRQQVLIVLKRFSHRQFLEDKAQV